MARLLERLAALVLDDIAGLGTGPAAGATGAAGRPIADAVSRPIGEEPLPGGVDEVARILHTASRAAVTTNAPSFLAYIPGGGLYAAALADFVANAFNRFTGRMDMAPALARLEEDVLSWLARAFGYDERARALLTPGGSLANLTAVITARHAHFGDTGDFRGAAVYTSSQAHHSIAKAVRLAGLGTAALREVAVDQRFRLRPDALAEAVAADRRAGARPMLVIAAAGTTNTGAIDPLGPIADICAREGLWLHVDGAYGGAFILCEQGRQRLAGIERADSITFDPHKGMFLPYGTGCLLIKDGAALQAAHHMQATYLQDLDRPGRIDPTAIPWSPADLGPELSRDFRGLRLWLPLMLHGAGAFRDALAEKIALAERFTAGLEAMAAAGAPIEIVARPELSLVAFRLARRPQEAQAAWNDRNARWMDAINARQRIHISSTRLPADGGEAFTLRVCVLSVRTHAATIEHALEDLRATLRESD